MNQLIRSMMFAVVVLMSGTSMLVLSYSEVLAAAGGNGNHYGWGRGRGNGGGGGGGGPLPALGATLLGQAIGAGGLYVLWRRRRNNKSQP